MHTSSPCCPSAIYAVGAMATSLTQLVASIVAFPKSSWTYRVDKESDKTCVVRLGSTAWESVAHEVDMLLQEVESRWFPPGYANRVLLSCVPSGEQILSHTDDFGVEAQEASVHCHIPLMTDPAVVMGYGIRTRECEMHLQASHLYILDATQRHWVRNPSPIDRVHLLFAYFPHRREDLALCYVTDKEQLGHAIAS